MSFPCLRLWICMLRSIQLLGLRPGLVAQHSQLAKDQLQQAARKVCSNRNCYWWDENNRNLCGKDHQENTSNPLFRAIPATVTPTPINKTSFLVYPKGVCIKETNPTRKLYSTVLDIWYSSSNNGLITRNPNFMPLSWKKKKNFGIQDMHYSVKSTWNWLSKHSIS